MFVSEDVVFGEMDPFCFAGRVYVVHVKLDRAQAVVHAAFEPEIAREGNAELSAEPVVRGFVVRVVQRVERWVSWQHVFSVDAAELEQHPPDREIHVELIKGSDLRCQSEAAVKYLA